MTQKQIAYGIVVLIISLLEVLVLPAQFLVLKDAEEHLIAICVLISFVAFVIVLLESVQRVLQMPR